MEALTGEFDALYAAGSGRPSIPPEMLLRAMLLQAFYTIRSERQLMERLEFDLLFRWFVGLSADEPAWDHSTFSKNRDRLLDGEVAAKFLAAVLTRPKVKRLLSSQHFRRRRDPIEAWASLKSFKPKPGADGGAGDITDAYEADTRRDRQLLEFTEASRASLASMQAALELLDCPDIDAEGRDRFYAVVRDEVAAMSSRVAAFGERVPGPNDTLAAAGNARSRASGRRPATDRGRPGPAGDALVIAEVFLKLLPLLSQRGILTLLQAREAARTSYYARLRY